MSEEDQVSGGISDSQMNEEHPVDELYSHYFNEELNYGNEANAAISYTNVAMDFDNIPLPGFPSPPGNFFVFSCLIFLLHSLQAGSLTMYFNF